MKTPHSSDAPDRTFVFEAGVMRRFREWRSDLEAAVAHEEALLINDLIDGIQASDLVEAFETPLVIIADLISRGTVWLRYYDHDLPDTGCEDRAELTRRFKRLKCRWKNIVNVGFENHTDKVRIRLECV